VESRTIRMERTFDAPRELVWRASTEAEHFARWWGPHGFTNHVIEMDVRPGGRWRVEQRAPDGTLHPFSGEFLEVSPPDRLVLTQRYRDFDPLHVTIVLTEADGRTHLGSAVVAPSQADRDACLKAGMLRGAGEAYDRLSELLKTM
jgi:uncharacterized protein YndB with AHSA1/START domain